MANYVMAAGQIIFSPAVWMIIVGMLLMKTGTQQLSTMSLPYADGFQSPYGKPLRRHFVFNIVAAVLSVASSLVMNVSLSLETVAVFWAIMLVFQAAKAMPASAFLTALAVWVISKIININFVSSDVLRIAIVSQALMGALLLVDSPDSYPSIAKQKDGSIKGVHNNYKVWFMPVFAYNLALSSIRYQMLFMAFFFMNARFTKETYRSYKKRNGIFMLCLSAAAAIAVLLHLESEIVILAGGAAASAWTVYEKIRASRAEDLFLSAEDGVRVLYVNPGGVGEASGILPGDIILSFNNNRIMNIGGIESFFSSEPPHVFIDIARNKKQLTLEYRDYQNGIEGLDCSYMPRKPVKYQLPED